MSNRIMFDIETLGLSRKAVVLTIGYAIFGKEKIVSSGQVLFDVDEQIRRGREIGFDTLKWWFNQIALKPELVKPFQSVPNRAPEYLYWVHQLLGKTSDDAQLGPEISEVWANGPTFDLDIIKSLFYEDIPYAPSCPWAYWQERDYRTFIKQAQLAGIVLPERPRDLPLHDAESDARYQAEMVLHVEQVQREAMHALAVGAHRKAKAVAEIDEVEGGGTVDCSLTEVPLENDRATADYDNIRITREFEDAMNYAAQSSELAHRSVETEADEEMHEVDFEEVPYREFSVSDYVDHYIKDNDDGTFSIKPIASVKDDGKSL